MYAVGVGNAVEDELREIASEPVIDHYFYTADFKTMNQIAKKLQINVCQGKEKHKKIVLKLAFHQLNLLFAVLLLTEEDPCECNSIVKFQKKVEEALQALTKKYILS